jgi:uncharacterized protein (TIGR00369 family)
MSQYHEELLAQLKKHLGPMPGVEVPPKIFVEMQGRFLDYIPEHSIICSFPSLEKYASPVGAVQGGILAAAIDNTFGPFAYLVAQRPCATVTMNMTYVRPITAGEGEMVVEARLVQKTKSLLFMSARLTNDDNRTVCTATTTMAVLRDKDL